MSSHEREALEKIVELAQKQLDMISDAMTRPGTNVAELTRASHELLMQAMGAHVGSLKDDASIPASTRDRYRAFAERVESFRKSSIQLRNHLNDLSEDWACAACKSDVATGATITGVKAGAGAVKVDLICKACGKATVLGKDGRKKFQKLFGHLISPSWNPEGNGFTWDHR